MGMVFADDFADDFGGFDVGAALDESGPFHRVEDSAVHRFQAVPDIGDRPSDVDAEGVLEISGVHDVFHTDQEIAVFNFVHGKSPRFFSENCICSIYTVSGEISSQKHHFF